MNEGDGSAIADNETRTAEGYELPAPLMRSLTFRTI